MFKYGIIAMVVIGLVVCPVVWARCCSAECSKGGKHVCGCQKKDAAKTEVESKGTLKSVDIEKGEMVFVPERTEDEIIIQVEASDLSMVKPGDTVKVTYIKGEKNVAERVLKCFKIKIQPKPCVPPTVTMP